MNTLKKGTCCFCYSEFYKVIINIEYISISIHFMGILFVSTDNFFLLFTKETSRVLWCRRYKFLGSLYKYSPVYTRQGIVALIRFLSISYHIMLEYVFNI